MMEEKNTLHFSINWTKADYIWFWVLIIFIYQVIVPPSVISEKNCQRDKCLKVSISRVKLPLSYDRLYNV